MEGGWKVPIVGERKKEPTWGWPYDPDEADRPHVLAPKSGEGCPHGHEPASRVKRQGGTERRGREGRDNSKVTLTWAERQVNVRDRLLYYLHCHLIHPDKGS
jgi:hypothetical protein